MSQPPDRQDDLDAAMRRMEAEFGHRPPPDGEPGRPRPYPPDDEPAYGAASPPQPPPRTVRVRISATSRPVAVWVIMAVIVAMYAFSCLISGSLFQPHLGALVLLGAKENRLIASGELWRLVGAMFLHGNLVHIFFNGYALFALGPENERLYGTARFLAIYFLAGIGGSVLSYLFSPTPSVGASGAIFGLMGSLGLFFYLNRQALGRAGQAQIQGIVTIGLINLFIGFSSPGVIDNYGHIGGLLAGLAAAFALAPRFALDLGGYQPTVVRQYPAWGWGAAAALGLALVAVAALLPGAR